MVIEVSSLGMGGVVLARVEGELSRTRLAASLVTMEKAARAGELRALIVDASDAVLSERAALGLEMWEDALSALPPGFPVCYVAPPGFYEKRATAVAATAREWATNLKIVDCRQSAVDWVSAQLAEPGAERTIA